MSEPIFNPFASEDVSPPYSDHWQAKRRLAQAIRELTDVLVTSTPSIEDMNDIAERLELQARQFSQSPRLYGLVSFIEDGNHGQHGEVNHELNAVGGWSNPLAPGMSMWFEEGVALAKVSCGWAYEGPPGHVHGGYVAALLDQFMGVAQILGKNPGMTGTLKVRYLRPTPLNTELNMRAELVSQEGRKTTMLGTIEANGETTASCEALFIRPGADNPARPLGMSA
jgi:hypothetical protein